jgi:NADP-dependent 3-hydroxy acid dehydrogenase YdfG
MRKVNMPDTPAPATPSTSAGLLSGKTIVITGASTGIGAEAARLFAREGAALVLGARSEDTFGSSIRQGKGEVALLDQTHVRETRRIADGC